MQLELTDKVVVVTGGAKGIGAAVVRTLAAEGAVPAIIDRDEAAARTLERELRESGARVEAVVADVTDDAACRSAIEQIVRRSGRLDAVVNNAGVNDRVGLASGSPASFVESLNRNLVHVYAVTHYALPALTGSRGAIVNIASKVAMTGQGGTSGYAAAKGGILALTREWAVELLKYGIRVNAIVVAECWTPAYDTWISGLANAEEKLKEITSKIPLENRMTTAEEIANATAFLLSERSSHTTGQIIHVDGGYVHLDRALANA